MSLLRYVLSKLIRCLPTAIYLLKGRQHISKQGSLLYTTISFFFFPTVTRNNCSYDWVICHVDKIDVKQLPWNVWHEKNTQCRMVTTSIRVFDWSKAFKRQIWGRTQVIMVSRPRYWARKIWLLLRLSMLNTDFCVRMQEIHPITNTYCTQIVINHYEHIIYVPFVHRPLFKYFLDLVFIRIFANTEPNGLLHFSDDTNVRRTKTGWWTYIVWPDLTNDILRVISSFSEVSDMISITPLMGMFANSECTSSTVYLHNQCSMFPQIESYLFNNVCHDPNQCMTGRIYQSAWYIFEGTGCT